MLGPMMTPRDPRHTTLAAASEPAFNLQLTSLKAHSSCSPDSRWLQTLNDLHQHIAPNTTSDENLVKC
jgi:hypothetical protein